MGTLETFIVFAAFMAIIALVAIAIDWVGKPLRGRRFIPRLYRFDDEVLPSAFPGGPVALPSDVGATPPVLEQPAPMPVPVAPVAQAPIAAPAPPVPVAYVPVAEPTPAVPVAPVPIGAPTPPVPGKAVPVAARAVVESGSVDTAHPFSAIVAPAAAPAAHATIAGIGPDEPVADRWTPGMALDARVSDNKPTPAIKAQRFWRSTALVTGASHFDDDDVARMSEGKAPRRYNPRLGRFEAMQLEGLRRASTESDVRMRWPGESIDPWSAR